MLIKLLGKIVGVIVPAFIIALFASPAPAVCAAGRAQQVNADSLIIVIDAGHGGENEGANEYGEPIEKDMTLTTALAMQQELQQYDGVTVYMTRMGDDDISLEQRAEFAASVNADFLFSLHYNASAEHNNFGSEVWVSTKTPYNAYGVQFGAIWLELMGEKGFYSRGVKAREGNSGDYYGVIREAGNRGIPAVIIEHCYVDQELDRERCSTEGKQQALGVVDATAVAKYFGLKSQALGVDYSNYATNELVDVNPSQIAASTINNDDGPDEVSISLVGVNAATGEVEIAVHAYDKNDAIIYYCYSTDGGQTYSRYYEWPESDPLNNENANDFTIKVTLGSGSVNPITVRAVNMFDKFTTSEPLVVNWNAGSTNGTYDDNSEETPGQWINDPNRLRQQAAARIGADAATDAADTIDETAEEVINSDNASSNGNTLYDRLFPDREISWLAVLIIVFPVFSGLIIAGIFIYRMTR